MPSPKALSLAIAAITFIAAPVAAQDLTATLHVQGKVMVSSGGEFSNAADGQIVVPGQRIMVGESASATVEFSQDCKRTYADPGVYTVTPAACRDDDPDRPDHQQDQNASDSSGDSPGSSTLETIGTIVGATAGIAYLLDRQDDDPVSR